jgi:hypothetical protein
MSDEADPLNFLNLPAPVTKPKCDLIGKNSDPNANCEDISPIASAPKIAVPQASQIPSPPNADILVTLPGCPHCEQARTLPDIANALKTGAMREVSIESPEGATIAQQYALKSAPRIIHAGEACQISTEGQALCKKTGIIKYGDPLNERM